MYIFSADNCTGLLVLGHSGASSGSHVFFDGPHARLPPMFPGYKLYLTPTTDEYLHLFDSVTEMDHTVGLRSKQTSGDPDLGHDADCQEAPPLEHRGNLRPLIDRLPVSPVAEENDPMELQSKDSGSSPEIGDNAQSQVAAYDESNDYPPLARSSCRTLLTIFVTFCLIFCVHVYIHPICRYRLHRGSSTQEHWGHDKVRILGWYEAGNDSLSGAYMDGNEAKSQDSQHKSDVKALHMPQRDKAERARWEVVRDWLDQILDGREWQGYA